MAVDTLAVKISSRISEIEKLQQAAEAAIGRLHELALEVDAADRDAAKELLRAAEVIGQNGQASEGHLIRLLAQAHRAKAAGRGGLDAWIRTTLDVTDGRARGIAQSAREIGHLPELAEPLSSGNVGASTIRALTRTAVAVKGTDRDLAETLTETLDIAALKGASETNKQVRILEELIAPGTAEKCLAKQRERSFLRIQATESEMTRLEVLIDPERATTIQAATDLYVSAALRARQYDGCEIVPHDVRTIEQLQAQALTRFAQVFLDATAEQRGAAFTAPVLYHAPLNENEQAGLAESVYGLMLPRTILAPMQKSASHILKHLNGQPVLLDGKPIDHNPAARLASPEQRTALAWRDKTCSHPGCSRPPTWSLHAHHVTPYSENGPTIIGNLVQLCATHHDLAHHPRL